MTPLQIIDELIKTVTSLTGVPLMVVDLLMFGYFLKLLHGFPNRWIPFIVVPSAALVSPWFMGWPAVGAMPHDLCCPEVTCYAQIYSQGALLGLGTVLLHAKLLRRFLDDKLKIGEGKTEFFRKPTAIQPP